MAIPSIGDEGAGAGQSGPAASSRSLVNAARRSGARWASRAIPSGRRRWLILGVAGAVVVVDQLTKTWALHHTFEPIHVIGTLQLALTFNPGAAFGLGRGITPVLVGGAIVLVVILLGLGRAASRTATLPAVVAMGLLLGGACGNLADRLVRHHHGAVIDFIDLRWWPVFNVADGCITVGALLLVLAGASRQSAGRGDGVAADSGAEDVGLPGPDAGSQPAEMRGQT
jgi:signal peptidase II